VHERVNAEPLALKLQSKAGCMRSLQIELVLPDLFIYLHFLCAFALFTSICIILRSPDERVRI